MSFLCALLTNVFLKNVFLTYVVLKKSRAAGMMINAIILSFYTSELDTSEMQLQKKL